MVLKWVLFRMVLKWAFIQNAATDIFLFEINVYNIHIASSSAEKDFLLNILIFIQEYNVLMV